MILKIQIFEQSKRVDKVIIRGTTWQECIEKLMEKLKNKGCVI